MNIDQLDAWATEVLYLTARNLRISIVLALLALGIIWSVALIAGGLHFLIDWIMKKWRKRNNH